MANFFSAGLLDNLVKYAKEELNVKNGIIGLKNSFKNVKFPNCTTPKALGGILAVNNPSRMVIEFERSL